jgi:hypothetical protein
MTVSLQTFLLKNYDETEFAIDLRMYALLAALSSEVDIHTLYHHQRKARGVRRKGRWVLPSR